mmetsp:Transcript_6478/g.23208  ORF Transcript_6478/g.23208 Transcript_6478/m.23208 type:complete len:204 (+) Transcript_6478:1279-1890(+)
MSDSSTTNEGVVCVSIEKGPAKARPGPLTCPPSPESNFAGDVPSSKLSPFFKPSGQQNGGGAGRWRFGNKGDLRTALGRRGTRGGIRDHRSGHPRAATGRRARTRVSVHDRGEAGSQGWTTKEEGRCVCCAFQGNRELNGRGAARGRRLNLITRLASGCRERPSRYHVQVGRGGQRDDGGCPNEAHDPLPGVPTTKARATLLK